MLKVWGCTASYFIPAEKRISKKDPTAREVWILSILRSQPGYVMDFISVKIVKSRSVKFRERWGVVEDYIAKLLLKAHGGHRSVVTLLIPFV